MLQASDAVNAVQQLIGALPRAALTRTVRAIDDRRATVNGSALLRRQVVDHYGLDLCSFLNQARRDELERMAQAEKLETTGGIGELRARLWRYGARLEHPSNALLGTPVQPVPIVLRGKLVQLGELRGIAPPGGEYPRTVGQAVAAPRVDGEPSCLEDLLSNADALVGVRMGRLGRNKGALGTRIALLLGVPERGHAEPDWRGEVEIKTVPVVRDAAGWWRVAEDPAICMEGVAARDKLRRVLWIARVAADDESPILSWYYQEWDAVLADLVDRYLHTRPKGGAGATTRGWYLHKNFFRESGLLRSLNG